jgi:hypothetical protein
LTPSTAFAAAPDRPPQNYARAGGILYLLIFALSFTLFAFPDVGAAGAPALQAVAKSEPRLYLICAAELLLFTIDVPLALVLYVLLRPVDRNIALLAAFFRLGNAFFGSLSILGRLAVLALLGNAAYRSAFTDQQLRALTSISLSLHGSAQDIGLVFFGLHCIFLGILVYRSGYLPKFIGVFLQIAGVVYAANSLANIGAPTLAAGIPIALFVPAFIAEVSLCLWLLIKGIDANGWMRWSR